MEAPKERWLRSVFDHLVKKFGPYKELVVFNHGRTWNDGGSWFSCILRKHDNTTWLVKMESDYQPDRIDIAQVEAVEVKEVKYRVVK